LFNKNAYRHINIYTMFKTYIIYKTFYYIKKLKYCTVMERRWPNYYKFCKVQWFNLSILNDRCLINSKNTNYCASQFIKSNFVSNSKTVLPKKVKYNMLIKNNVLHGIIIDKPFIENHYTTWFNCTVQLILSRYKIL